MGQRSATYQSVNPANGKFLESFKELACNQLETAIETAASCFDAWRRWSQSRTDEACPHRRICSPGDSSRFEQTLRSVGTGRKCTLFD